MINPNEQFLDSMVSIQARLKHLTAMADQHFSVNPATICWDDYYDANYIDIVLSDLEEFSALMAT